MSFVLQPLRLTDPLRRLLALGCAGLVLALSVFAASPAAHELLHDDDHDTAAADHTCAVVMFAGGVGLPVGPVAVVPPTTIAEGISPVTAADVFLLAPRYLHQPERGPPSNRVS